MVSQLLKVLMAHQSTIDFIRDSHNEFKNRSYALKVAQESLEKFNKACSRRGGVGTSLPSSMRIQIADSVRFTPVLGQPQFYAQDIEELRKIEVEVTQKVFHIINNAKTKHIKHLEPRVVIHSYVDSQSPSIRTLVTPFFRSISRFVPTSHQPASTTEKNINEAIDKAVKYISNQLMAEILKTEFANEQAAIKAKQAEAVRLLKEIEAQERVLSGAQDGTNIAAIATKAATKVAQAVVKSAEKAKSNSYSSSRAQSNKQHIDTHTGRPYQLASVFFQQPSSSSSSPQPSKPKSNRKRTHNPNIPIYEASDSPIHAAAAASSPETNISGGEPLNTQPQKKQKNSDDSPNEGASEKLTIASLTNQQ